MGISEVSAPFIIAIYEVLSIFGHFSLLYDKDIQIEKTYGVVNAPFF